MILTLTSTAPAATDLGYLLHKHPDKVFTTSLAFGQATVVYPEASPERCTVALLVEVDPVGLVRRKHHRDGFALSQYVNDRPYAASSLLSVAIGRAFGTALNGRCDARPELVDAVLPLEVRVAAVRARAGFVRRVFEPLGWSVDVREQELAEGLDWGVAPHVDITLRGEHRVADALGHLYVLLPVLDDTKHYWMDADEVDKLLRRGGDWLAGHPDRELITRRYLRADRRLVEDATARLDALEDRAPEEEPLPDEQDDQDEQGDRAMAEVDAQSAVEPLRQVRLATVLGVLREVGAHRVVDLGCGEGLYLRALLADPTFTEVVGVDVSPRELEWAERRLARLSDRQRARLTLRQSSATYRDDALAGVDALLLVEVVEHLDPDRLGALAANVFGHARPAHVVVTTPNAEHNVRYDLPPGAMRHPDHRFEWTREGFRAWATAVAAAHGYGVQLRPVGPDDPEVGPPTQLALFSALPGQEAS